MTTFVSKIRNAGIALTLFAIVGTGVVAFIFITTAERIVDNERLAIQNMLSTLVPTTQHDNDMFSDTITVLSPSLLGSKKPLTIYRARIDDEPVAAVFEVIAPNGYNGKIKILVAIHYDGIIAGVRIVSHKETPGLGDDIEIDRSDWVMSFDGHSLSNPTKKGWNVRKDGGEFDQFTGATITPRAVVKAVHNSLKYFSDQREEVFQLGSEAASDGK
ncbi:Electron transport complex protein RnfG [hydrothermal vent metagenome]|uniref:Electron transport complex protein RnfG n=1 Tax=hydrothermal vent metagenome TaxID=652676 RepID=A0A3B0Z5E5_9ZZZZ